MIALVLAQSADLRPSRRGERPNPRLWTWLEYHLTNTDPDDCWLWEGPVGSWGYPVIGMFSRIWKGNRLIWTVLNGPIPDGLLVCHFCDVPACMNPFHLWLGTNRDNARDMAAKGRAAAQVHPESLRRGSQNPRSKLTEDIVREIRGRSGTTATALAREFGVSRRAIGMARQRQTWQHVE